MPRILGVSPVSFSPSQIGGLIPVGAVIPLQSNITGAYAPPVSGVVLDGFMRCDGAVIPGGEVLSGTLPDLSGNRFLMGSTVAGSLGGNALNQKSLSIAEMPSHTHVMDHGHGHNITTNATGSGHGHGSSLNAAGQTVTINKNQWNTNQNNHVHEYFWGITTGSNANGDIHSNAQSNGVANFSPNTTGVIATWASANATGTGASSAVTGSVGGADGTHTHGIAGGVTSHTGNTGPAGTGTVFDIRPLYLSTVYLIRVS